jgi:hypothetical protein
VDLATFNRAIAKMGVVVEEEDLEVFFNIYDANRSGTLDYKEFSDVVFGRSRPQTQSSASSQISRSDQRSYKG